MELKRIDIGINLMNKRFKEDRLKIVEKAHQNGVGLIITGTDLKSSVKAVDFVRSVKLKGFNNIWCTVGCHPHNAKEVDEKYGEQLLKLIQDNSDIVVAVGECGLDYDRMFSTRDEQLKALKLQMEIASKVDKPLFLHERKAEDDFIKTLKKYRNLCRKSVVHCFTGTKETVYRYLQLGFMIGITGWICDNRRNKDLIEALKIIPLERLMIETDAPYLTPLHDVKTGEKLNLSKNITECTNNLQYILDTIAYIKQSELANVERITYENTIKTFKL